MRKWFNRACTVGRFIHQILKDWAPEEALAERCRMQHFLHELQKAANAQTLKPANSSPALTDPPTHKCPNARGQPTHISDMLWTSMAPPTKPRRVFHGALGRLSELCTLFLQVQLSHLDTHTPDCATSLFFGLPALLPWYICAVYIYTRLMGKRHNVFVSFHNEDQGWKDEFVNMMNGYMVDQSVNDGDIDENAQTDTIRRQIREEHIARSTVTVVLIGPCTWKRKHIDWEISYSMRETSNKDRCGLLGILLPNHPDYNRKGYRRGLIPQRLATNLEETDFASLYDWSDDPAEVQDWIHQAFKKRHVVLPSNSDVQFARNRGRDCSEGWD